MFVRVILFLLLNTMAWYFFGLMYFLLVSEVGLFSANMDTFAYAVVLFFPIAIIIQSIVLLIDRPRLSISRRILVTVVLIFIISAFVHLSTFTSRWPGAYFISEYYFKYSFTIIPSVINCFFGEMLAKNLLKYPGRVSSSLS